MKKILLFLLFASNCYAQNIGGEVSNPSSSSGPDFNSTTATSGNILIGDGTGFNSMALSGNCTLQSDGKIYCTQIQYPTGNSPTASITASSSGLSSSVQSSYPPFIADTDGDFGINGQFVNNTRLAVGSTNINSSLSDATTYRDLYVTGSYVPLGDLSSSFFGLVYNTSVAGFGTISSTDNATVLLYPYISGLTIAGQTGIDLNPQYDTDTITTLYGQRIRGYGGSSSITTYKALSIEALTNSPTITTNYAIHQADSSAINNFEGRIVANNDITVPDSTATDMILLGSNGDASIYHDDTTASRERLVIDPVQDGGTGYVAIGTGILSSNPAGETTDQFASMLVNTDASATRTRAGLIVSEYAGTTDTSDTAVGLNAGSLFTNSGGSTATSGAGNVAGRYFVRASGSGSTGTIAKATALSSQVINQSSATKTFTEAVLFRGEAMAALAGTITAGYGLKLEGATKSSGGTFTNYYGLYLPFNNQGTTTTPTNYYGQFFVRDSGVGDRATNSIHFGESKTSVGSTKANQLDLKGTNIVVNSTADLADINSTTITGGNLLVADGNKFQSVSITGDVSINSSGVTSVVADTISLNDLSDVNSATATSGNILVGNGTAFDSVSYAQTRCGVFVLDGTDNKQMGSFTNAATVSSIWCHCTGTCSTMATITMEDTNSNAMTITGTNPTCAANTSTPSPAAVTSGNSLTAYEGFQFDVTNTPSPTTDTYDVCVKYSTNPQ